MKDEYEIEIKYTEQYRKEAIGQYWKISKRKSSVNGKEKAKEINISERISQLIIYAFMAP